MPNQWYQGRPLTRPLAALIRDWSPYETDGSLAGCRCHAGRRGCRRGRLHGPLISTRRWRGRPDLRGQNPARIPRLEVDLRGPRRRQPQRFARHSGQRRSDQSLPRRQASVPGRHNHRPTCLELRPVGGKRQSLWPRPIFRGRPPKNGVQFMVKDSRKYASTGGWGFAHFDDGKPASEAVHNTCFPCHGTVKARDFVFNRYAP
jgi:hypothetical protein